MTMLHDVSNTSNYTILIVHLPYFLDKARVSHSPPDERNFHIFYALLAAPLEERQHLGLTGNGSAFAYLAQTSTLRAASVDDAQMYQEAQEAFKVLGVPQSTVDQIFQVLAAVLLLGNIVFCEDPVNAQDAAIVKNMDTLDFAADLLGVRAKALLNTLTFRSKLIKRDITTLFLDPSMASKQRDDFAQTLYAVLFTWIVEHINSKLSKQQTAAHNWIALLDGGSGPSSRLEQSATLENLAVNFVNEALHQSMLTTIFEKDMQDHQDQGLVLPNISRINNMACMDAFVHPSKGILSTLNTQALRPQHQRAKDDVVMDHFISANKNNDTGVQFKKANHTNTFTIQHFWGQVDYNPNGFTQRNEDYLCSDFVTLFQGNAYNTPTTNGLLATLFGENILGNDMNSNNSVCVTQHGIIPRHRSPVICGGSGTEQSSWDHVPTMGDQLLIGVQQLQNVIQHSVPWFVLCMRPNDMMLSHSYDSRKVASQVAAFKLSSLIPGLRIFYNTVFSLQDFWDRYCVSIPMTTGTSIDSSLGLRDRCLSIIQTLQWDESDVGIGQEKIYLSNQAFCILETDLRSLEKNESNKNKSSPTGLSPVLYSDTCDALSFNDDQYSSALSDGAYDLDNTSRYNYSSALHTAPTTMIDEKLQQQQQLAIQQQQLVPGFIDGGGGGSGNSCLANVPPDEEDVLPMTGARRKWLILVWFLTWWVPSPLLEWCGGMKRKDIRLAWREKVTLCILIFLMSASMVVFIILFGPLVCPHQDVYSLNELQSKSDKDAAFVAIRGEVFDLTKFAPHHWASEVIPEDAIFDYAGKDATNLFPLQVSALCDGTDGFISDEVVLDFQVNLTDKNAAYHDFRYFTNDYRPDWYYEQLVYIRKNYRLGFMGYEPKDILRQATSVVNVGDIRTHRQWAILHGDVYDLTYYLMGGRVPRAPVGQQLSNNVNLNFMDNGIVELFRQLAGTDISKHFDALPINDELRQRQLVCLRNLFFVGKVDTRRSVQCQFSEYFLLIVTGFLCAVIVFKFLAALQLGTYREPEEYDKFIVCQVPCYTESEDSLRKTIDSIAVLRYDDKRKLIFLVCDGMLIGSGNDRPTPRIVLDILGVDPNVDPEPLSFLSLGEGAKQHNMGKIYSGLYECAGHVVPYVVVVKVGAPGERQKPGNRGKRDSQMVLMRFLNKIHFESPMAPMELEMYHQIKNVIGVNPGFYEFVLMVDADTEVLPDSLNRMVSCFVHDSKVIGLCGETKLANEKDSWVTMIQVYEYYISHFLAKAFESLFGSVTCLPGCFCMYRVRSPAKQQPLLISNQVVNDYSENRVSTLHQKNLLHLGEDRYLTTLILKHFPTYKTRFTSDAGCLTNAPDRWSILLSQRRRWINSTIHNLGELMFLPQLCGFCCFSMRFVVILDLLSTLTMPAIVCYLIYLIYRLATDAGQVPMISMITLGGVYGLQAVIFILRRKWEHIGWMIVYILAIPLFSFFIPIYSFWHFDDFSWGNTRVVVGEGGHKKAMPADEGRFDPKSIPLKKWKDHENEIWETNSVETKVTQTTALSKRSQQKQQHQHRNMSPTSIANSRGSIINSGMHSMSPQPPWVISDVNSMRQYSPSQQLFYAPSTLPGNASICSKSRKNDMLYSSATPTPPSNAYYAAAPMMNTPSQLSYQQRYSQQQQQSITIMDIPDEDIMCQVQRITTTTDLTKISKKQIRNHLSAHYGVEMTPRKDFINQCINDALRYD
ncbi:chitin synthase-domain-containing protein [Absidia repens]|uniref:chitin synthase n=1 Tax=Absidia repens TaxID=90262 RepID=A0A1X2I8Y5_9FUNG|nr:chitin synthase-domain-containing protein [Absidia repens]